MKAMKLVNSALGVANFYSDIVGNFVIDLRDSSLSSKIGYLDMNVFQTDIIMRNSSDEKRLVVYHGSEYLKIFAIMPRKKF